MTAAACPRCGSTDPDVVVYPACRRTGSVHPWHDRPTEEVPEPPYHPEWFAGPVRPTGAERYLTERLKDPEYRAAYEAARTNDLAARLASWADETDDGIAADYLRAAAAKLRELEAVNADKHRSNVAVLARWKEALGEIDRLEERKRTMREAGDALAAAVRPHFIDGYSPAVDAALDRWEQTRG